jgi:hypothetical protein
VAAAGGAWQCERVIEAMTPDRQRLPPGETIQPFAVTPERLGFYVWAKP